MDKFEEARKWAERTYPYYFKHMNAHPWSFNGIMSDIQHALYNGQGLTRKDKNLEKRIDSLQGDERRTALAELQKAERLYNEREAYRKSQREKFEKEKEESEKRAAISEYRKEWKSKGFFYKLTHGKKKPDKMNFSQMSIDEIERASEGLHR